MVFYDHDRWQSDSWRDGYDAWKTRSPDDDHPYHYCCPHDEVDPDGFDGWGRCKECGEQMKMHPWEFEELRARDQWFDEMCRKQEFEDWWRGKKDEWRRAVRRFLYKITGGWVPERKRIRLLDPEDIPF